MSFPELIFFQTLPPTQHIGSFDFTFQRYCHWLVGFSMKHQKDKLSTLHEAHRKRVHSWSRKMCTASDHWGTLHCLLLFLLMEFSFSSLWVSVSEKTLFSVPQMALQKPGTVFRWWKFCLKLSVKWLLLFDSHSHSSKPIKKSYCSTDGVWRKLKESGCHRDFG